MLTCKNLFLPGLILTSGVVFVVLLGGCTTDKTTETARSATEQLLLSTATDHALQSADFMTFMGRKVFLDATYFDSYDSKYVIGTIRDALSRAGAVLEDNVTNSDIIIEARSGALAIDSSESLFGVPNIAVPVPLAGSLQIPELAFYKSQKQASIAKIALLAFTRESREHVYSSGPLDGKSYDKHVRFLFLAWIDTDVPEKQKNVKKMEHYQTWFPQYEHSNLPETNAPMKNLPTVNMASTNSLSTNLPSSALTSTNLPATTLLKPIQ